MDGRLLEGIVLSGFLCAAAVVDFRSGFIYDRLTAPMAALACGFRLYDGAGFVPLLLGLLAGGGPLLAIRMLSRGGLGGGDVKLAAAGGLWLGWQGALLALALAAWSGGLAAIFLLASGKKRRRDSVAFGPFLAFGIGAAFFFGERLLAMYGEYCRG
ncbi:MAG: prepilin peptidase [Schwartzia sp.]|nr:prepilin peptidase [Schwartzia sp. (in: firmicutes)]